jgi:hypothetical protein
VVGQATTVVSFFACMAVAFLLHLSFVFASDEGSTTPLKYIDPTGHGINTILFDNFLDRINRDKTSELNIWIGDAHVLFG